MPWAYTYLASLYREGIGAQQSYFTAMDYYKKAYFAKNFEGLSDMADMYWKGQGGDKKPEIAAYMYKRDYEINKRKSSLSSLQKLADAGVVYAQYANVAMRADPEWFAKLEMVAETGNPYALCGVGLKYFEGETVDKDMAKAFRMFRQSAEANNLCGRYRLGSLYANGTGVMKDEDRALRNFNHVIHDSHKYAFNHPQRKDVFRKAAQDAIAVIETKREDARIKAYNREISARNARVRKERDARAAAEKQAYKDRCIRREYLCRDAIGMVNYEVCEYMDVDVCAAERHRRMR